MTSSDPGLLYVEVGDGNSTTQLHAVRRHQTEEPKRRRKPKKSSSVFYSVDGDAVPSYTVEITSDEASALSGGSGVMPHVGNKGKSRHPPSSRFTYNDSLRHDVVEEYDVVKFRYGEENEPTNAPASFLAKKEKLVSSIDAGVTARVTPSKSPTMQLIESLRSCIPSECAGSDSDPFLCKEFGLEVSNAGPEILDKLRNHSSGQLKFLRKQAGSLTNQLDTRVSSRGTAVEIFPSCDPPHCMEEDLFQPPKDSNAKSRNPAGSSSPAVGLDRSNSILDQTSGIQPDGNRLVANAGKHMISPGLSQSQTGYTGVGRKHADVSDDLIEPTVVTHSPRQIERKDSGITMNRQLSASVTVERKESGVIASRHRSSPRLRNRNVSFTKQSSERQGPLCVQHLGSAKARPLRLRRSRTNDSKSEAGADVSIDSESAGLDNLPDVSYGENQDEVDAIVNMLTAINKTSRTKVEFLSNHMAPKDSSTGSTQAEAVEDAAYELVEPTRVDSHPKRLDAAQVRKLFEDNLPPIQRCSESSVMPTPRSLTSRSVGKQSAVDSKSTTSRSVGKQSVVDSKSTTSNSVASHVRDQTKLAEDMKQLDYFLEDHYFDRDVSTISAQTPSGIGGCIVSNLIGMADWIDGDGDEEERRRRRSLDYAGSSYSRDAARERNSADARGQSIDSSLGVDRSSSGRPSRSSKLSRLSTYHKDSRTKKITLDILAEYSSDEDYSREESTVEPDGWGCWIGSEEVDESVYS